MNIAKQRRQLCGYIVAGRSGHGACVTKHAIPHIKNNHAPPTISFVNGINQTIRNPSMRSFRDLFFHAAASIGNGNGNNNGSGNGICIGIGIGNGIGIGIGSGIARPMIA